MRIGDGLFGLLFCIFAAGVLLHVRSFPTLPGQFYGPGFFPAIVLVALLLCGLALIARSVRQSPEGSFAVSAPAWSGAGRKSIGAAMVVVFALLFYLAGDWIGFVPLTFGSLLILYLWLGRGIVWSIGLSISLTLLIEGLFRGLLRVPLPEGLVPALW
ncbi:MAG: tripartite tricarboxylate transporter TctB family protein [Hyphomicrobiaceae bacterium]